MTKNNQDELIRACTTLQSLRENIKEMKNPDIEETFVNEFHNALDKLASSTGKDVSDFRIPDSKIAPIRTDIPVTYPGEGHTTGGTYSKEKYVDKPYLLTKIDSVLKYLEIITSEKPKRIGFRTSQD